MRQRESMTAILSGFINTLERLEQVIDMETEALQQNQPVDLSEFNHKKSHCLLELSRAMRVLDRTSIEFAYSHLNRLRDKVEKNLSILDIHMKAVRAVSAIIANAIQDNESDGTYSFRLAGQSQS